MTTGATEQMAAACLGANEFPAELRTALLTSADGNPFLVEELVAAWTGDGVLVESGYGWTVTGPVQRVVPLSFAETARSRLARLDPDERRVLEAASILGRRFDWTLLAPMLALDDEVVLSALRSGVDAQLLQALPAEDDAGFRFRHAMTRDALLADLLPPEAEALARRALEAIQQRDPPAPDGRAHQDPLGLQALIVELAERAGERAQAARLLLDLGRAALAGAALETAEAALVRARRIASDHRVLWLEILEVLVEVYSSAGRLPQALEAGESLLGAVPASSADAARVHLRLARAAVAAEHWEDAMTHLDRGRSLDDPATRAQADALAALVAIGLRSPSVAEELARASLGTARSIDLPNVECLAWQVLGRCARLTDLDRARECFDRAVGVATDHDLPLQRIEALHERATIDLLKDNDTNGLEDVRAQAARAGALSLTAVLDVQIAGAVSVRWRSDELLVLARRAAEVARLLHLPLVLSMALLWEAAAHAQRGDGELMERFIAEAMHDAEPDAEAMSLGLCRAVLALQNDHREAAMAHLDAAEALLVQQEAPNPWGFRGLRCFMRTIADDGGTQALEQLRRSGATVWWMNRGWLQVSEAVVAGREGDARAAAESFARGDETLAAAPWFRQVTRLLVAEAASAAGWGEPVAWLRSAADFFDRSGHGRLRASCHAALRRLGEPVPRRGRGDAEVPPELRGQGVTSREVDVLWLVAEGLGNREIAARLVLSPRTVEKHVASLVAKTGAADRSELADLAARLRA